MFKENKKQLNLTLIALLAFAMLSGVSCSSSEKGEEPLSPEEKAEKRFSFLKKGDQAHSKSYETIDAERVVFKSDSPVRLTAEELKKLESPAWQNAQVKRKKPMPEKIGLSSFSPPELWRKTAEIRRR